MDKMMSIIKSELELDAKYKIYIYDKASESKLGIESLIKIRDKIYNGGFDNSSMYQYLSSMGCDVMDFQQFKRSQKLDNLLNE